MNKRHFLKQHNDSKRPNYETIDICSSLRAAMCMTESFFLAVLYVRYCRGNVRDELTLPPGLLSGEKDSAKGGRGKEEGE